jgi:hypothetical protein
MRNIRIIAALIAAFGLVTAQLAQAAPATRSGDALPASSISTIAGARLGTINWWQGVEQIWNCVEVTDQVLDLDHDHVQVDTNGMVVLDAEGVPYRCNPPAGYVRAGFPFEVLLGILGLVGVIGALAGGGGGSSGNDSPG